MNFTQSRWQLPLIGLVQGIILAAIHYNFDLGYTVPLGVRLAVDLTVLVPILYYATEAIEGLSQRARMIIIATLTVVTIAILEYNTWVFAPTTPYSWQPQTLAPMAVFLFIATHLLMHWSHLNPTHHAYRDLYKSTWRNAILCLLAVGLTGLFWLILNAGAELFKLIGITALRDLIDEEWFNIPATASVFSIIIATALLRHESFENLRRLLLGLLKWFLPLVLALAAVWVVCLPFTGLNDLFKNRSAAAIMLPTVALAVLFINAAYEDGDEVSPYQSRVSLSMKWLWLALIPVSLIALWAFHLRVTEYSWTAERIWGTFVTLLAILYAVGYGASTSRQRAPTWMPTIARTNRIAAVVICAGIIALLSPLLDAHRIEAQAQVKRVQSMKQLPESDKAVRPETKNVDVRFTTENGRFGLDALSRLDAKDDWYASPEVARDVRDQLPDQRAIIADNLKRRDAKFRDGSQAKVTVINPEAVNVPLDTDLRKRIANKEKAHELFLCSSGTGCTIWWQDLNSDGLSEAVVIGNDSSMAEVYVLTKENTARQAGTLMLADGDDGVDRDILRAVKSGNVQLVPNPWKRVKIGNNEFEVR